MNTKNTVQQAKSHQATPDLIIRRAHGFQVDHIGICVPDTKEGVRWLEEKTGAKVRLAKPEPGQWYQSGGLNIAKDSFLEVVGPNPDWQKFHPINAVFKSLPGPQILFWYIAVSDFESFRQSVKSTGRSIQRIEKINIDRSAPNHASYIRGFLGSGLFTQRPNIIQWLSRPDGFEDAPLECTLTGFRLAHPEAQKINKVIDCLGIDIPVEQGPAKISLTLDTPKGTVVIENEGIALQGAGMILKLIKLRLQSL